MSLDREALKERIKDTETPEEWNLLYEEHFGEEVPYTGIRNPNEHLQKIINSLKRNKKIVGIKLNNDFDDNWE